MTIMTAKVVFVDILAGASIQDAISEAIIKAKAGVIVVFNFNGIKMAIRPDAKAEEEINFYYKVLYNENFRISER